MTPKQRVLVPPWGTQDVPYAQQIVTGQGQGPSYSLPPEPRLPGISAQMEEPPPHPPEDFAEGGPWSERRIATAVPFSKAAEATAHQNNTGRVGVDNVRNTPVYAKQADAMRRIPGLRVDPGASAEAVHRAFVDHVKSNLRALYNAVPETIRPRSKLWYKGANRIAQRWAEEATALLGRHVPIQAVAGLLAALSPQKDWFQNVSLARRILDTLHTQADAPLSPEAHAWGQNYVRRLQADGKSAEAALAQTYLAQSLTKPLSAITDPLEKAHWVRFYDEAHNDRGFLILTPEGEFGGPVLTKQGTPDKVGWGPMKQIANAISSFDNPTMSNISRRMGAAHKVRNFYNNIVAPDSRQSDVTIDTHAIAAALLRPLSGNDREVEQGLGSAPPDHAESGSKGLYGPYADAYRELADELGVLPRELQSITWEAVRGLFPATIKGNKAFKGFVSDIWDRHKSGQITLEDAQRQIIGNVGGAEPKITAPSWHSAGREHQWDAKQPGHDKRVLERD
jgi:hypothetical protein